MHHSRSMVHRWRTLALTSICALAALIALPSLAEAKDRGATTSEKLHYEVRFRGARVATILLQTGCPTSSYRPAALVAKSLGFVDELHSFHIRFDSFLATQNILPRQGRTRITEEGRTRRYISTFAAEDGDHRADVRAKIFDRKERAQQVALPGPTHDMLSWLLHLRRHNDWEPKASTSYFVWDGWKLSTLRTQTRVAQPLTTPYGTYRTHPIDLKRTVHHHSGDEKFQPKEEVDDLGTLWFTTGGDHVLVGMDFHSRLGTATIRLTHASRSTCK